MRQEAFESRHAPTWTTFEEWIGVLSTPRIAQRSNAESLDTISKNFPAMYRQVCHHLALARTRRYSIGLQQRLNQLALDGHQHLYRTRTPFFTSIGHFLARDFPATFRKQWRFMLTSTLLFYLPALVMALAVVVQPEIIFSLLDPGSVSQMEEMYDPANDVLGRERESDSDFQMFGYYIYNNISVGFRTFAGGLLFGLGSLFFLIFNGLYFWRRKRAPDGRGLHRNLLVVRFRAQFVRVDRYHYLWRCRPDDWLRRPGARPYDSLAVNSQQGDERAAIDLWRHAHAGRSRLRRGVLVVDRLATSQLQVLGRHFPVGGSRTLLLPAGPQ